MHDYSSLLDGKACRALRTGSAAELILGETVKCTIEFRVSHCTVLVNVLAQSYWFVYTVFRFST